MVNMGRQLKHKWEYVVISPVRDEANHIAHTIESILCQTIIPSQWIIVDDGSSDGTGRIIDEKTKGISWIRKIERADRGQRVAGTGVIQAFYDGLKYVSTDNWEVIVKLDGDISFDPDYFEKCFAQFEENENLGIIGGTIYNIIGNDLLPEIDPRFHVRGASKIYRRLCWEQIGGLIIAPGWDTLDEVKANMMGWKTMTIPDLKITHYRPTDEAHGHWYNWVKNGRANYISGYHPLFMIVKCLKRIFQKPYMVAAAGLFVGFLKGYIEKEQIDDKELVAYLRSQQLRRLCFRETIWK